MTVVARILDRMGEVAKPQRKFFLTLIATMIWLRFGLGGPVSEMTTPFLAGVVNI